MLPQIYRTQGVDGRPAQIPFITVRQVNRPFFDGLGGLATFSRDSECSAQQRARWVVAAIAYNSAGLLAPSTPSPLACILHHHFYGFLCASSPLPEPLSASAANCLHAWLHDRPLHLPPPLHPLRLYQLEQCGRNTSPKMATDGYCMLLHACLPLPVRTGDDFTFHFPSDGITSIAISTQIWGPAVDASPGEAKYLGLVTVSGEQMHGGTRRLKDRHTIIDYNGARQGGS